MVEMQFAEAPSEETLWRVADPSLAPYFRQPPLGGRRVEQFQCQALLVLVGW